MKKLTMALLLVLALLFSTVRIAGAVTDGHLDGNGHPYVVLLLMEIGGEPAFRCSGTLLSPTVLLTAGHCTSDYPDEPYSGMRVFTESDVEAGIGTTNNYPLGGGPNSVEAKAWYTLPGFEDGPFYLHDVGVVILQKPGVKLSEYGTLPTANQFDSFKTERGQYDLWFTSVGYGLQKSFPTAAGWKDAAFKTRYYATPQLIRINTGFVGDYSLLLSNNANTGGTCFGDSGGPNFLLGTNVVAGVTSFGLNSTCGGTGGVFRMDRQNVLDFVQSFLKK